MPFLFALASSVLYGSADFLGGYASRRGPLFAITVLSQALGLVALLAGALMVPAVLGPAALAWGVATGLSGGVGVLLLYRALAVGTVSTVAPLISLIALAVPVAAGLLAGEHLGVAAVGGIALGMTAVAMIGAGEAGGAPVLPTRGAIAVAVSSGICIGAFLVCLGRIPSGSGLWPLVAARGTGLLALTAAMLVRREPWRVERGLWLPLTGCGVFDVSANLLYWLAAQHGPLALVATIVSLAPASTVVLAQLVLRERLSVLQKAGVAVALAAIALLAQGTVR